MLQILNFHDVLHSFTPCMNTRFHSITYACCILKCICVKLYEYILLIYLCMLYYERHLCSSCISFSFYHVPFYWNTLRQKKTAAILQTTFSFFFNENIWISIKISLKFIPKGPNNNIPELVEIMAWRRPGDKPLSEPMMVSLVTHICIIRPQWIEVE